VDMSNAATDVFFDVLALAGSAVAATSWQRHLTLCFCDGERVSRGASGFDLADVPWTGDRAVEKDFFLRMVDLAAARHGWDRLHYDPPHVRAHLLAYRRMLLAFTPQPVAGSWMGDWTAPPKPHEIDLCGRHGVFRGEYECRLCDAASQPIDAPKVWELISCRKAGDWLAHREVRQIPDEALPRLRPLFDVDTLSPAGWDREDLAKMTAWWNVEPSLLGKVESILDTTLDPGMDHYLRIAIA